jgi:hypothetical protein
MGMAEFFRAGSRHIAGCHKGVPVLSDQVYRTCRNGRAVSLYRHGTLAVKAASDTQNA